MIIEGSTDLIRSTKASQRNGQYVEMLLFRDQRALVIASNSLGLYKNEASIYDPLGNGLLDSVSIPEQHQISPDETPWIEVTQAGFVGLKDGKALLILPNNIKLYANREYALKNLQTIAQLVF